MQLGGLENLENLRTPSRKRPLKVATQQRDHTQLLLAVLYLGGVVLLFNAWLVSQNLAY